MDSWRRQKRESYRQEGHWPRSNNRRPPTGSWQATVPSWEKDFCAFVGAIPWRRFLEMKKFVHLHDNVAQWDDSAGEEAFHNAKSRYWAEINGLPCDIAMPNPNIYIDKVDWNTKIDPKLISDLDCESIAPCERVTDEEDTVPCNSFDVQNPPPPTGWGDDEGYPTNVDESSPHGRENRLEANGIRRNGGGWGDDWGTQSKNWANGAADGGWGPWNDTWRRREYTDRSESWYKAEKQHWTDRGWRNEKKDGKRVKFVYERSAMNRGSGGIRCRGGEG